MNARIGLVRHGAHHDVGRVLSGRTSDIGISQKGRREVEVLAANLAECGAVRVESSPRLRTRETAEILGTALSVPVSVEAALDEIDFGDWSGKAFAELDGDPAWHLWNTARAAAPTPGGETMKAAVERAVGYLDRLGAADETVLCVSHCDVIRGVVAHYLGLSLSNILRFGVGTASICWLAPDGQGSAQVLTLNGRS